MAELGNLSDKVKMQLLRVLGRLSYAGAIIYPFLFVLLYFGTDVKFGLTAFFALAIVLPSSVARFLLARKIETQDDPEALGSLQTWMRVNVLACVLGWSIFAVHTIVTGGFPDRDTTHMLLLSTGLAAGGANSLAADLSLARAFITILWLAHAGAMIWLMDTITTVSISLYCLYLLVQLGRQHERLVSSFQDRESLVERQEELALATQEALAGQVKLEQALRLAEEARLDAEQASSAKSRFLATISHEIRTPLHGVLGMNTLLLDSDLNEEQQDCALTVRRSGEALLSLINEVLDFSKLEAGKQEQSEEAFAIEAAIDQALEIVAPRATEKSLELSKNLDPSLPPQVFGDMHHLRQILLNFLSNAVKFTDLGEVRLDCRLLKEDAERIWAEFQVSDSGIGISADDLARLFEPFQQVNSSTTRLRGGTGLGLAICKRLASLMGGEIRVESEPGEGSTFTLRLPFLKTDEVAIAEPSRELTRLRQNQMEGTRILVAEDNPTNQKILSRLLSKAGYECEIVENGKQAIQAVVETAYDLVLMDCHMPEMDGYDATREIQGVLGDKAPSIIAVTANATEEDRRACLAAGMVAFIGKPVRLHELQEALDQHLPEKKPRS